MASQYERNAEKLCSVDFELAQCHQAEKCISW